MRAVLCAAAIALAGCATLAPPEPAEIVDGFSLSGRFSARHGDEAGTGRIQWRHAPTEDELMITSPLGQGLARLTRQGSGPYVLETADERRFTATDPQALTEQALGWRLPVSGLPAWLRGEAAPGSEAQLRRDDRGLLRELRQDGWRLEYPEYFTDSALPRRVHLARDGLEIRLVIDEWGRLP